MPHPSAAELIEFDDRNEQHLGEHGIAAQEVSEVFFGDPLWASNTKGHTADWLMIGRSGGGRALRIGVVFDEVRLVVRPITGRACEQSEITKWGL